MIKKEQANHKPENKIILLLIPPLLNFLNWEKISPHYHSLADIVTDRKGKLIKWQKNPKTDLISLAKSLDGTPFNKKVSEILRSPAKRIIFINYPLTKESWEVLEEKIQPLKLKSVCVCVCVFVSLSESLALSFAELQKEMMICPVCKRSYKKKETIQEKAFRCPVDEITLPQEEMEKLTDHYLNEYFNQVKSLIEAYRGKKNKIIPMELKMREDLEPTILQNYLIEKIHQI